MTADSAVATVLQNSAFASSQPGRWHGQKSGDIVSTCRTCAQRSSQLNSRINISSHVVTKRTRGRSFVYMRADANPQPNIAGTRNRKSSLSSSTASSSLSSGAGAVTSTTEENRLEYERVLRNVRSLRRTESWNAVIRSCDDYLNPSRDSSTGPLYADARMYAEIFFARVKRGWVSDTRESLALWNELISHDEKSKRLLTPRAFMSVMQILSRHNLVTEAAVVRKQGMELGFHLNRFVYNAFLNACAKQARLQDAFEALEEMASAKLSPDVVSFNCLISCCVNAKNLDIGLTLLERMKEWGVPPDIYTYNVIVNGLRKHGRLDAAFHLVAKMEKESQQADAVAAEESRKGKRGRKKVEKEETVMPKVSPEDEDDFADDETGMAAEERQEGSRPIGIGLKPDLVTYNTLLAGLASQDPPNLKRALRLKKHIESRGLECNEVSFNALMATAARGDHIHEAFGLYAEMISKNLRPNCECFTTLITLCARARMMRRAFNVHKHMIEAGIRPTVVTFNALITACRECGDSDGALSVIKMMKEHGGCEPDVITYSSVIDTLGRNGRMKDIERVLEDMRNEGVEPNLVTYTTVIAARTRAGDLEGALETLKKMEQCGISPNVYTFSSLINGAGRAKNFDMAFALLQRMRNTGIQPTAVTYLTLLQSSARAGRMEHFEKSLQGIMLDNIMNTEKDLRKVLEIAEMVFDENGIVDRDSLNLLLDFVRTNAKESSWGPALSKKSSIGARFKHVGKRAPATSKGSMLNSRKRQ